MAKAQLYAALKTLFPPQCYHCKKGHEKLGVPLCAACFSYLEARVPDGTILITFDKFSPAQSLLSSPNNHPTLAAYMAMQYAKSTLPLPDIVTGAPASMWRKWQKGHEGAASIAKHLAQLLDCPYRPLLYRKRELLRQDLLPREERKQLMADDFEWRKKHHLQGKTVLLVDETITTGATLACCAERLWEGSPTKIIKMACVDRGYLKE